MENFEQWLHCYRGFKMFPNYFIVMPRIVYREEVLIKTSLVDSTISTDEALDGSFKARFQEQVDLPESQTGNSKRETLHRENSLHIKRILY